MRAVREPPLQGPGASGPAFPDAVSSLARAPKHRAGVAFDPAIPNSATDDARLRPCRHEMSSLELTPNSRGTCPKRISSRFRRGAICLSNLVWFCGQIGHFGTTDSIHSQSRQCSVGSGERSFKDGSPNYVVDALRLYQNADGGFGNALEPDIRCPDSQPVPVQYALKVLDPVGLTARS